jgi:hypothetical protein
MAEGDAPAKGGYKQVCKYSPKRSSFLGYLNLQKLKTLILYVPAFSGTLETFEINSLDFACLCFPENNHRKLTDSILIISASLQTLNLCSLSEIPGADCILARRAQ